LAKFHGIVDSISLLPEDSGSDIKQSPANLSVADFRFVDQKLRVEYIRYHYTNSHLPYMPPPGAEAAFSEKIQSAKSYFAMQQAKRLLIVAALVCTIIIPLIIAFKKIRKPSFKTA
jgi:hypothetical protein